MKNSIMKKKKTNIIDNYYNLRKLGESFWG